MTDLYRSHSKWRLLQPRLQTASRVQRLTDVDDSYINPSFVLSPHLAGILRGYMLTIFPVIAWFQNQGFVGDVLCLCTYWRVVGMCYFTKRVGRFALSLSLSFYVYKSIYRYVYIYI